jgi:serine/threonine protein kinase
MANSNDIPSGSEFAPSGVVACPRCGKQILAEYSTDHVCEPESAATPLEDQWSAASHFLQHGFSDQSRIVNCTECGKELDVSGFDPLEAIECFYCKQNFELLRQFGEYKIVKAYDVKWHHAVYLGVRNGERSILKVLSSHVLGQTDALGEFLQQAEEIHSRCNFEWVTSYNAGQIQGFAYLAVGLKHGISEEELLENLGISHPQAPEAVLVSDKSAPAISSRKTECPKCHHSIDASFFNPLDEIECPKCAYSFEIFHHFGNYRLDYRLNLGGTSILYLGFDTNLKRKVAIKILTAAEMVKDPSSGEKMIRELGLTQKLIHPNVIQIYGGGEVSGFYFLAMELVEGKTLDEILHFIQHTAETAKKLGFKDSLESGHEDQKERFKQALPELICLEIILQAAAGLGIAHSNGLVHGDVKPDNIIITREGVVKILDFGLVQFANAEKLLNEGDHSIYGTPFYIPPERVVGLPEDFRSDIYSLGATLYHLLRGIPPFRAKTPVEIVIMHAESPIVSFKAYAPWVSETTCRIVEKSLKKSIESRYSSHIEFIADLTLAKELLKQQMKMVPKDGRLILKTFMKCIPIAKPKFVLWKRAATTAIRTYKYMTMVFTARLRARIRDSASP